jgi:dephospho-CoA kinase
VEPGEAPRTDVNGVRVEDQSVIKVAVTGNVASGKSTLSRLWAREGIPLVQADELARAVVEPGTEGLTVVVDAFGKEVLTADGSLDRSVLRDLVFREPESRIRLEEILHPLIQAKRRGWMNEREEEGVQLAVAEIPLLFEAGLEGDFDFIVLVDAPHDMRLRRLLEDRGLEEDEAMRMMDAQMPPEEKKARAHYVIQNGGSPEDLEVRALALLDLLRARSAEAARQ